MIIGLNLSILLFFRYQNTVGTSSRNMRFDYSQTLTYRDRYIPSLIREVIEIKNTQMHTHTHIHTYEYTQTQIDD